MRTIARATLLAAALLAAPAARAQAGGPGRAPLLRDPAAHHHQGFFIRPDVAFGYLELAEPGTPYGRMSVSGPSLFLGLSIGGAVAENVVLALRFYDAGMSDPTLRYTNYGAVVARYTTVDMGGIGPQLTWYFMPANVYLSATLALTRVSFDAPDVSGRSDVGWGGQLAVGKEWYVSQRWGLGLFGALTASANRDLPTASALTTWGLGLGFSATYN